MIHRCRCRCCCCCYRGCSHRPVASQSDARIADEMIFLPRPPRGGRSGDEGGWRRMKIEKKLKHPNDSLSHPSFFHRFYLRQSAHPNGSKVVTEPRAANVHTALHSTPPSPLCYRLPTSTHTHAHKAHPPLSLPRSCTNGRRGRKRRTSRGNGNRRNKGE